MAAAPGHEDEFLPLFPPGAALDLLADGGTWFEGPAWTGPEEIVWSDVVGNRLLVWTPEGGAAIALEPSHHQNGHAVDGDGRLVAASHGERAVVRRDTTGHWEMLTDRCDGLRYNSPNDVVVRRDGSIWFTDPRYGIDKPEEGYGGTVEMPGCRVYRLDPSGAVSPVTPVMPAPNGLAFSADEEILYVADSQVGQILALDVTDGGLEDAREIVPPDDDGHPDGLRVDTDGRIWTSWGSQVRVYRANGQEPATLLGAVHLPETVANLAFGGPDRSTLAITATSGLYRVRTTATGATP